MTVYTHHRPRITGPTLSVRDASPKVPSQPSDHATAGFFFAPEVPVADDLASETLESRLDRHRALSFGVHLHEAVILDLDEQWHLDHPGDGEPWDAA